MEPRRAAAAALALLAALAAAAPAAAFKAEDFKRCADSAFCVRLRNATSDSFRLDAATLKVAGASVRAALVSNADPAVRLDFELTAYEGVARLRVTEPSAAPPRFEVPDVLLPSVPAGERAWAVEKRTATLLRLRLPGEPAATADLRFAPVVSLSLAVAGAPLVTWNGDRRFAFERRRGAKAEGDPEGWWAESFKTHHDSKPRGPEALAFDLRFHGFDHVYGLPERAAPHSLRPTITYGAGAKGTAKGATTGAAATHLSEPYRLYNLDVFEYDADSPFGLYGSIPLMWAHRPGATAGAFWLNAAEMFVDVAKEGGAAGVATHWLAEAGVVDLFLLLGATPAQGAARYARLTGGAALPQMFALGYHQCRWNYKDEADVAAVDAGFDAHDIPYDVLWLDIEHTDGKRYFTWDATHFPTPARMQEDVAARGRKMVTIVDPHIKRDPEWRIYKEARDRGLLVRDKEGKEFDGWCWPGSSAYVDWADPAARSWWADQFALDKYQVRCCFLHCSESAGAGRLLAAGHYSIILFRSIK
jgi:alpha 1,3-glucosidase